MVFDKDGDECEGPHPRYNCRCGDCRNAREESIPFKLREACWYRPKFENSSVQHGQTVIDKWLDSYIEGKIGLAEMQVELIYELAELADERTRQVSDMCIRVLNAEAKRTPATAD